MRLRLAQAAEGRFYATLNDICAVFLIDRVPFIDIQYERLPSRFFLTPLLMNLSAVTIATPESHFRFDIDNSDSRNPVIKIHELGLELDTELFRSFFRLITRAAHDGTFLGEELPIQGEALLQIIYEYASPDKGQDSLYLYQGAVRRVNVGLNGVSEFAMNDLFVERVIEGVLNLISGNPIEENWYG
jgi:hypothetical protein